MFNWELGIDTMLHVTGPWIHSSKWGNSALKCFGGKLLLVSLTAGLTTRAVMIIACLQCHGYFMPTTGLSSLLSSLLSNGISLRIAFDERNIWLVNQSWTWLLIGQQSQANSTKSEENVWSCFTGPQCMQGYITRFHIALVWIIPGTSDIFWTYA